MALGHKNFLITVLKGWPSAEANLLHPSQRPHFPLSSILLPRHIKCPSVIRLHVILLYHIIGDFSAYLQARSANNTTWLLWPPKNGVTSIIHLVSVHSLLSVPISNLPNNYHTADVEEAPLAHNIIKKPRNQHNSLRKVFWVVSMKILSWLFSRSGRRRPPFAYWLLLSSRL